MKPSLEAIKLIVLLGVKTGDWGINNNTLENTWSVSQCYCSYSLSWVCRISYVFGLNFISILNVFISLNTIFTPGDLPEAAVCLLTASLHAVQFQRRAKLYFGEGGKKEKVKNNSLPCSFYSCFRKLGLSWILRAWCIKCSCKHQSHWQKLSARWLFWGPY